MGIIKLELDIPDFEKELNVNITLRKDGVVVDSVSTTSSSLKGDIPVPTPKPEKQKNITTSIPKASAKVTPKSVTPIGGGNMMNIDF
jgi:hypothetical protein